MTLDAKVNALRALGAQGFDMDSLLAYTANAFSPRESSADEDQFLQKWEPVFETAHLSDAAQAVNLHLARQDLQIAFEAPGSLTVELFQSLGGDIPIITTGSTADFEKW